MTPLFRFRGTSVLPIPVLNADADGALKRADNIAIFDLATAAKRAGATEAELNTLWHEAARELLGMPELPTDDVARPANDDLTALQVVRDDGSAADWDKLSDEERAAVIQRRRYGLFHPADIAAFELQARANNWNPESGECYPRKIIDTETGEVTILCVAKLEAIEKRVLQSGLFDGMDEPLFCGPDGKYRGGCWLDDVPPAGCQVTLYRKGVAKPYIVNATRAEFVDFEQATSRVRATGNPFWDLKGPTMLLKCTLASGYRRAFRDVLGDVYCPEELPRGSERRRRRGVDEPTGPRLVKDEPGPRVDRSDAHPDTQPDAFADDVAAIDADETPMSETEARHKLMLAGLKSRALQDVLISEVRKKNGVPSAASPRGFWNAVVAAGSARFKRFG